MDHLVSLQWYIKNIWAYVAQMTPCMCLALVLFLILRPVRVRRLTEKGLISTPLREFTLLLFWIFVAGLGALTLFPAEFWSYVLDRLLYPEIWGARWNWIGPADFYPSLEQVLADNRELHNLFVPFQEIRRAMLGIPWLTFMLLGNIFMFVPIGFFSALLWRNGRWWRSFSVGLLSSGAIEAVQFFIGRRTDVDDLILNTAGAMLGFLLYCVLRFIWPKAIKEFQCYEEG